MRTLFADDSGVIDETALRHYLENARDSEGKRLVTSRDELHSLTEAIIVENDFDMAKVAEENKMAESNIRFMTKYADRYDDIVGRFTHGDEAGANVMKERFEKVTGQQDIMQKDLDGLQQELAKMRPMARLKQTLQDAKAAKAAAGGDQAAVQKADADIKTAEDDIKKRIELEDKEYNFQQRVEIRAKFQRTHDLDDLIWDLQHLKKLERPADEEDVRGKSDVSPPNPPPLPAPPAPERRPLPTVSTPIPRPPALLELPSAPVRPETPTLREVPRRLTLLELPVVPEPVYSRSGAGESVTLRPELEDLHELAATPPSRVQEPRGFDEFREFMSGMSYSKNSPVQSERQRSVISERVRYNFENNHILKPSHVMNHVPKSDIKNTVSALSGQAKSDYEFVLAAMTRAESAESELSSSNLYQLEYKVDNVMKHLSDAGKLDFMAKVGLRMAQIMGERTPALTAYQEAHHLHISATEMLEVSSTNSFSVSEEDDLGPPDNAGQISLAIAKRDRLLEKAASNPEKFTTDRETFDSREREIAEVQAENEAVLESGPDSPEGDAYNAKFQEYMVAKRAIIAENTQRMKDYQESIRRIEGKTVSKKEKSEAMKAIMKTLSMAMQDRIDKLREEDKSREEEELERLIKEIQQDVTLLEITSEGKDAGTDSSTDGDAPDTGELVGTPGGNVSDLLSGFGGEE
jgi:hypothetical protein